MFTAMSHTMIGHPVRTNESNGASEKTEFRRHQGDVRSRVFFVLLLAVYGIALGFFCLKVKHYLPVVSDNNYPEAAAAVSVERWVHGMPLYEDYRRAPFLVTAFPPLWYALLSVPARLGWSGVDAITLAGRCMNLGALLLLVAVGYAWNRRLGLPQNSAVFGPLVYLSFPVLIPWAVASRPDFPSLLFAGLALCILPEQPRMRLAAASGLLAGCAFLIKHNAVAVPVAIVLWLVWNRKWKHAALFSAAWGALVGSTLVLYQMLSKEALLINLSGANFGRIALTYGRDTLWRLLVLAPEHGFSVVLVVLGGVGFWCCWKGPAMRTRLAGIYVVVALGLAAFGSSAAGGDINHYLEPAFALSLLVPTAVFHMRRTWIADSPTAVALAIAAAVLLLPALDFARWETTHIRPVSLKETLSLMANRRVLTDVPYLSARSSRPQALDLASLTNAGRAGRWSADALVQEIARKEYDLVIVSERLEEVFDPSLLYPRYPHLDAGLRAAVRNHYDFCFESASVYVYSPRTAGRPQALCPVLAQP